MQLNSILLLLTFVTRRVGGCSWWSALQNTQKNTLMLELRHTYTHVTVVRTESKGTYHVVILLFVSF